jgi:hypothetical protein
MKEYDNPKIIGQCVEKDIRRARIYHALLSKLIVNLRSEKIYAECRNVFEYLEIALENEFVLCLGKIFGDTKEGTLWQLLKILESSSKEQFEKELQKYPNAPHSSMRQARRNTLNNIASIENEIKKIKENLKPLRNTERVHNIPWLPEGKEKTVWGQALEWLDFAEQKLEQIMDSLCESALRVGDYYSNQFDGEINHFLELIKMHNNSIQRT